MTTAHTLTAVELRRELGRVRRTHSDRTVWQVAQDAYVVLFTVVLLGSMAISALVDVAGQVTSCAADVCSIARGPMPLVVLLMVAGATVRGLSVLGPVVASPAASSWLLSAPTNRTPLLRRPFGLAVLVSAGSGAVVLAVAATVAGTRVRGVVTAAAIGLSVGALASGTTALAQPAPRARRVVVGVGDGLLVAAAVGVAVVAFGGYLGDAGWLDSARSPSFTGVLAAVALVVLVLSVRRLARLALPEIVSGGELLSGLAGAAYALDLALIGEIVAGRRFRLLGARPSRRGRLSGQAAIVEREFRRLGRSPGRFVALVALGVVPELFDRAGLAPVAPLAAGAAGYAAVRWSASGFRRVWRSPGLRRALPFDTPVLLRCFTLPAGVLSVLWAGGAALALSPAWPVSVLAVALSVFSGVVRAAAAKRPDYAGPLVTSPMGAVPPGLFTMLIRGPDAALLGTIALAAGTPPLFAVGIPAVILAVVIVMALSAVDGRRNPLSLPDTRE